MFRAALKRRSMTVSRFQRRILPSPHYSRRKRRQCIERRQFSTYDCIQFHYFAGNPCHPFSEHRKERKRNAYFFLIFRKHDKDDCSRFFANETFWCKNSVDANLMKKVLQVFAFENWNGWALSPARRVGSMNITSVNDCKSLKEGIFNLLSRFCMFLNLEAKLFESYVQLENWLESLL